MTNRDGLMTPPKVAACILTKNSAGHIGTAIDSVRAYVDEVNVYDTGSTDDTPGVVDALRAAAPDAAPVRIVRGEWRDDFAWAFNQSFAMASSDVEWILRLDDDERLEGGRHLRDVVQSMGAGIDMCMVAYTDVDASGRLQSSRWADRLVRRQPGFAWVGAIHEVWAPTDPRQGTCDTAPAVLSITQCRPSGRYPDDRNLALLRREVDENKRLGRRTDTRTMLYLGLELEALGRYDEGLTWLRSYLGDDRTAYGGDERAWASSLLMVSHLALNDPWGAVVVGRSAMGERPGWADHAALLSEAYRLLGYWPEAVECAEDALRLGPPDTLLPVRPSTLVALPLTTLALAAAKRSDAQQADAYVSAADAWLDQEARDWLRQQMRALNRP